MTPKAFSLLTVVTTALAAVALSILPYEAGIFPGGALEAAALGPVPLWTICSTLAVLLAAICVATACGFGRTSGPN